MTGNNNTQKANVFNNIIQNQKAIGKHVFMLLAVLLVFVLIIPVCSATSIQKFGIDSKTYAVGDNISVSGEILDGNASGR